MTDKKTEALKLALEWHEWIHSGKSVGYAPCCSNDVMNSIRSALAEQPAQQRTDYAWPTLADYERDVGFQTNEAFRAAWNMARTTNKMLGFSEPQPAQDQGQSCYCPECERLSKDLAAFKAQQQCMEHGECFGGECIYPAPQPAQQQELEELTAQRDQLADILTRTANALKGQPAELSLHSWHDLPEVAQQLKEKNNG